MKPRPISRRNFLKNSSAAAGALVVAPTCALAAETSPGRFDPFEAVPLGKTGVKFSRVCMGTGVRGGRRQSNHTRMGREKCEALMRDAYERGREDFLATVASVRAARHGADARNGRHKHDD